jgi:hypothetical protein
MTPFLQELGGEPKSVTRAVAVHEDRITGCVGDTSFSVHLGQHIGIIAEIGDWIDLITSPDQVVVRL